MSTDLDQQLERMQADGRISVEDADEVRNFASFLVAMGALPKRGVDRTPEQQRQFIALYREYYPEDHARHVAEQRARRATT